MKNCKNASLRLLSPSPKPESSLPRWLLSTGCKPFSFTHKGKETSVSRTKSQLLAACAHITQHTQLKNHHICKLCIHLSFATILLRFA
ncbi:hypothetical protein RRG08_052479 [Elysia crispata]|uniref:Uncharacterized protein n=1 Tax=Elysia crispata TaxID=231223 RepID=A0AAE1E8X8_9GAST|nr:hypothetical protein RRG08_052479 [Elysia crispata]